MSTGPSCLRWVPAKRRLEVTFRGSGSAISEGGQSRADQLATRCPEGAESGCEQSFWNGRHIVKGSDTVVVDPLVGANGNAGRNASDRACDGCDHDVVEDRYGFIARYDEDRTTLVVGRFEEPKLTLGYQGSASVMAMAFASAS